MEAQYTFTKLNDPGHGWVSVPRTILHEMGIADQVSSYSYQKAGRVYLEEDCDQSLLEARAAELGITINIIDTHHDNDYVRNMDYYRTDPASSCIIREAQRDIPKAQSLGARE